MFGNLVLTANFLIRIIKKEPSKWVFGFIMGSQTAIPIKEANRLDYPTYMNPVFFCLFLCCVGFIFFSFLTFPPSPPHRFSSRASQPQQQQESKTVEASSKTSPEKQESSAKKQQHRSGA